MISASIIKNHIYIYIVKCVYGLCTNVSEINTSFKINI